MAHLPTRSLPNQSDVLTRQDVLNGLAAKFNVTEKDYVIQITHRDKPSVYLRVKWTRRDGTREDSQNTVVFHSSTMQVLAHRVRKFFRPLVLSTNKSL